MWPLKELILQFVLKITCEVYLPYKVNKSVLAILTAKVLLWMIAFIFIFTYKLFMSNFELMQYLKEF